MDFEKDRFDKNKADDVKVSVGDLVLLRNEEITKLN